MSRDFVRCRILLLLVESSIRRCLQIQLGRRRPRPRQRVLWNRELPSRLRWQTKSFVYDFAVVAMLAQFEFRDPNRFGEFVTIGSTTLHPMGLALLGLALVSVVMGSRRNAAFAAVALMCVVSSGQRVVLASVDFSFLRILAMALAIRVLSRSELARIRLCRSDYLVMAIGLWPIMATFLRADGTPLMTVIGQGADSVLLYFSARALIRSSGDLLGLLRPMVIVAGIVLAAFIVEKSTGRNAFATFGGLSPITAVREGKLRAQGAFAHPILAGVWWAAMIPLYYALVWCRQGTADAWLGRFAALASFVIVFMTASSTPFAGVAVAGLAVLLIGFRKRLVFLWVPALVLAAIYHLLSANGVHHLLMARFRFVTGSTGYHRYRLIDAAINRFDEWYLLGGRTTYHWGWGLDDVTCQYVAEAMRGGIVQLGLFVWLVIESFRRVGLTLTASSESAFAAYAVGASIAVHACCFLAVTYFGQISLLFWMTIGACQSLTQVPSTRLVEAGTLAPGNRLQSA